MCEVNDSVDNALVLDVYSEVLDAVTVLVLDLLAVLKRVVTV